MIAEIQIRGRGLSLYAALGGGYRDIALAFAIMTMVGLLQVILPLTIPINTILLGTTQALLLPCIPVMAFFTLGTSGLLWSVASLLTRGAPKDLVEPLVSPPTSLTRSRTNKWMIITASSGLIGLVWVAVPREVALVVLLAVQLLVTASVSTDATKLTTDSL
jgi:hypothetical protein